MSKFEYMFGSVLGEFVLGRTDILSKTLQSPKLNASEGQRIAELTCTACAKIVVYARVYFCVYFAYTVNILRVVYISNIHLVYFKNPQVTIIHCAYSRSIKNTQTTMNYATHAN